MKIIRCAQRSHEWWEARLGHVTGSKVAAVLSYLKRGGETQARANYRMKVVAELLTGIPESEGYVSAAMDWGNEQEAFARGAYEVRTNCSVSQFGFMLHDTIPFFGGSVDGLVGEDGGTEFKSPDTTTHLRWICDDVIPEEHVPQMLSYMSITGRRWWDFVSFDPRPMDPRYHLFIKRLHWDDTQIAWVEDGVKQFLSEVHDVIERLKGACPVLEQLRRSVEDENSELGITDEDIAWIRTQQEVQQ